MTPDFCDELLVDSNLTCLFFFSVGYFCFCGKKESWPSISSLLRPGVSQLPPPTPASSSVHPLARRLDPCSLSRIKVTILEYPISLAILAHLEYKKLQAFFVPSVQSLVTSKVLPLSRPRATGRPTMATPTIFPPFFRRH